MVKEIANEVKKSAEMDGADADLYMKMINIVMSSGHGMQQVLPKRASKVVGSSIIGCQARTATQLCYVNVGGLGSFAEVRADGKSPRA